MKLVLVLFTEVWWKSCFQSALEKLFAFSYVYQRSLARDGFNIWHGRKRKRQEWICLVESTRDAWREGKSAMRVEMPERNASFGHWEVDDARPLRVGVGVGIGVGSYQLKVILSGIEVLLQQLYVDFPFCQTTLHSPAFNNKLYELAFFHILDRAPKSSYLFAFAYLSLC